jgi:hypothetical protein
VPVNFSKDRISRLALLDRALVNVPDADIEKLLTTLPEDHVDALHQLAGFAHDPDASTLDALRSVATKGRINGQLEQIASVLADTCLADCIEVLGENAELPSEENLHEVLPGLVERHGLGVTRLMLAAAIAGEAPASVMLTKVLKNDPTYGLPPAIPQTFGIVPSLPAPVDSAEREKIKARRKEEQKKKQAAEALRRQQIQQSRRPAK